MKKVALIAFVFLTGCASEQPIIDPVAVDTPVVMSCKVASVPVPKWAMDSIRSTDSHFDKLKAALSDLETHIGYEAQLLAAQSACQ